MPADDVGGGGPGADSALEAALGELFARDPTEFVATRKRLASELRAAGDAAGARALEGTRRPTKSAWALNVLARRRPELIEGLLDRSDELRIAQNRAIAGDPGSQRDATRAQRRALTDAADAAVAILGGTGEAARAELLSTLQAAAADEAFAAVLRAGRLERTEISPTGFPQGLGDGDVVPPDVLAARRARRMARREPSVRAKGAESHRSGSRAESGESDPEHDKQEEARRRAADELDHAEELLRAATDDAAAASARVSEVEARVADLRSEIEAVRLELRAAKDRAAAAAREETRRRRDVVRRRGGLGSA